MNHAYLLTGGNLGDRAENLQRAKQLISVKAGKVLKASGVFETAAWGKTSQPDYLNQALLIETPLSARELLETILRVEKQLGRLRQEKYDARIIDIDILFFNDEIVKMPDLIIPHPHIQNRRFVLVPLLEIAAGFLHPVLLKTVDTLLKECPDPLDVKKFSLPIEGKQVDL
jgi:2-amino-4-hydroxy-6-hydroxymethyldihydropteridine diphosphokinase